MERFRFDEQSSGSIEGDIVDREGDEVPAASLTSAQLTLYNVSFGSANVGSPRVGIINSRDAQNVLNTANVTIDSDGHFIWSVQPEDNDGPSAYGLTDEQIAKLQAREVWRNRAMFKFAWSGGEFRFECELDVNNLRLQA